MMHRERRARGGGGEGWVDDSGGLPDLLKFITAVVTGFILFMAGRGQLVGSSHC